MTDQRFALFETMIGTCGIVWTTRGVCGVQLPEKDPAANSYKGASAAPDGR